MELASAALAAAGNGELSPSGLVSLQPPRAARTRLAPQQSPVPIRSLLELTTLAPRRINGAGLPTQPRSISPFSLAQ